MVTSIISYTGVCLVCVGLVITAVGVGEKGFTVVELQMVGPGIVLCGVGMIVGTIVVTSCGRDSGDKDTLFRKRSVGHRVEDTDTCSEDTSVIQIETGHGGGQLYRRSPYRLRTP